MRENGSSLLSYVLLMRKKNIWMAFVFRAGICWMPGRTIKLKPTLRPFLLSFENHWKFRMPKGNSCPIKLFVTSSLCVFIAGISKVTVQVPVGKEWELCVKLRVQAAEGWSGFSSFVCLQASLFQWVAVSHFLILSLRDFTSWGQQRKRNSFTAPLVTHCLQPH